MPSVTFFFSFGRSIPRPNQISQISSLSQGKGCYRVLFELAVNFKFNFVLELLSIETAHLKMQLSLKRNMGVSKAHNIVLLGIARWYTRRNISPHYDFNQCFFSRDIFFLARDNFLKNARDIEKTDLTFFDQKKWP